MANQVVLRFQFDLECSFGFVYSRWNLCAMAKHHAATGDWERGGCVASRIGREISLGQVLRSPKRCNVALHGSELGESMHCSIWTC